jgi:hypothetical protein
VFNEAVLNALNLSFPFKTVTFRQTDPHWMSTRLKLLIQQKDQAFRNKSSLKYSILREKVIAEINLAKLNGGHEKLKNCRSAREKWKVMKGLMGCQQTAASGLSDSQAAEVNDSFASFFEVDASSMQNIHQTDNNSSRCHPWNEYVVLKELLKVRKNACGPDELPGYIFRHFALELAPSITHIFNACRKVNTFPTEWKKANVVPINKAGGGYRPISLLPIASKIFEKLFISHDFLPSLKITISTKQFAFVPNSFGGTSNALTLMRHWCLRKLDQEGGIIRLVAIDFSKAFDKASHNKIVAALQQRFMCDNSTLNIIQNFMTNRFQRVITPTFVTEWKRVTSGVPQGSILGPLLFAILMDDIEVIDGERSKIILYADDLTLLTHVKPCKDDHTQRELDHFFQWSTGKKMIINNKKRS